MITILLVDDRAPLREALRALLSLEPDLCVIGEAADGLTAVTMAAERDPDVVVMDVKMPHLDGIAATRALRRSVPRSRVIMVSLYDDPATRARRGSWRSRLCWETRGGFRGAAHGDPACGAAHLPLAIVSGVMVMINVVLMVIWTL